MIGKYMFWLVVWIALPAMPAFAIDIQGAELGQSVGVSAVGGEAVVPKLIRAYMPGLTVLGQYSSPGSVNSAASGDLMGQVVMILSGAAQGAGAGHRVWIWVVSAFGLASMWAAFLLFREISAGRKGSDEILSQVFRISFGVIMISYGAAYLPTVVIKSCDWILEEITGDDTMSSEKTYTLGLLAAATGQATANSEMEAAIVAGLCSPTGPKEELRRRYIDLFSTVLFQNGNADSYADTVIGMAKANDETGDQTWGWRPGQNYNAASDRFKRIAGLETAWDEMNLDSKRARLAAIVNTAIGKAHSAVVEATERDIAAAAQNALDKRLSVTGDALVKESIDPIQQEEARQLSLKSSYEVGLSMTAQPVNKSGLKNSYNIIDQALSLGCFLYAVSVWTLPWVAAASAIAFQFEGATRWKKLVQLIATLVLTAVFISIFACAALAQISGQIIGSTTAGNTGSWLSWLAGIDIHSWIWAGMIVVASPALAIAVVTGGTMVGNDIGGQMNPGGTAGPGTGGGWGGSGGRSLGGGEGAAGGESKMSIWDKTNNGNKS